MSNTTWVPDQTFDIRPSGHRSPEDPGLAKPLVPMSRRISQHRRSSSIRKTFGCTTAAAHSNLLSRPRSSPTCQSKDMFRSFASVSMRSCKRAGRENTYNTISSSLLMAALADRQAILKCARPSLPRFAQHRPPGVSKYKRNGCPSCLSFCLSVLAPSSSDCTALA